VATTYPQPVEMNGGYQYTPGGAAFTPPAPAGYGHYPAPPAYGTPVTGYPAHMHDSYYPQQGPPPPPSMMQATSGPHVNQA